jgi:hypothetical protein
MEFRVPYGLNPDNRLVCPDLASKESSYRCPGCLAGIVLRKGDVLAPHFGHLPNTACSKEEVLQRTAIGMIQDRWNAGADGLPKLLRRCGGGCGTTTPAAFPKEGVKVSEVELEGGQKELALVDGAGKALWAIRIWAKEASKGTAPVIPWVAVASEDVLAQDSVWFLRADGLPVFECPGCAKRRELQDLGESLLYRDDEHPVARLRRLGEEKKRAELASFQQLMRERPARLGASWAGREAVGLWKWRDTTLCLKMTLCPTCQNESPLWLWPGDRASGELPEGMPVPGSVKRVPGSPLWTNYCACAGCAGRLAEMSEESFS